MEHYGRPQWTQAFISTSRGTSSGADMAKGLKLQRERSWDLGFQLCLTCRERWLYPSTLPSTSPTGTKRSLFWHCTKTADWSTSTSEFNFEFSYYCKSTLIYRTPPKVLRVGSPSLQMCMYTAQEARLLKRLQMAVSHSSNTILQWWSPCIRGITLSVTCCWWLAHAH